MSFFKRQKTIHEGDTAVLYLGHGNMLSTTVTRGNVARTKRGNYLHQEMIGKPYGTKVYSHDKKRWIFVLHPSPELWTLTLPHRTQILYSTDIAMITMKLNLHPGAIVVESGTGSGSLSHAMIRSILPSGHLYTFDFHQQRADTIREEFKLHGLESVVTAACRDVCADGFQLSDVADAVFLDLPKPWEAIKSAKEALKKHCGRICSFSPCIEQVQRTCLALNEHGFVGIETVECLRREFDVKSVAMKALPNILSGPEVGTGPTNMPHEDIVAEKQEVFTAKPFRTMPGHTGYLTCASLYEIPI